MQSDTAPSVKSERLHQDLKTILRRQLDDFVSQAGNKNKLSVQRMQCRIICTALLRDPERIKIFLIIIV